MSSVLINEYPVKSHSTSKVLTVIEEMPENTTDSCRYSWYKLCRVCLSQAGMSCNLRHLQIYKVHLHTYIHMCTIYYILYIYSHTANHQQIACTERESHLFCFAILSGTFNGRCCGCCLLFLLLLLLVFGF